MAVVTIPMEDVYVLNYCAKSLARDDRSPRHNFGQFADDALPARVAEPWRFPLIDSYSDGVNFEESYRYNAVTFVYYGQGVPLPDTVGVIGTFGNLYTPLPLRRVAETPYYTVTAVVPKGQVHQYKYLVNGNVELDAVNPQRVILENGQSWSRFFTDLCTIPITFERWELGILNRLTSHILPFETAEGQNFLERFYDSADRQTKDTQYAHAYRLDQPVGVVNFIDKLLAKEESHRIADYRTCLELINRVLRSRNPVTEPGQMPKEMYRDLYDEMARDSVAGWDYGRYGSPRFFLQLLRRHTFTGAFSHPRYGGNVGAAGWAYLEERYRDEQGQTLFQWRRIMERPLGTSVEYHG